MLGLKEADTATEQLLATAPRFRAALTAVIADGAITDEERRQLYQLAADLALPPGLARQAIEHTTRTMLDRLWLDVTARGELTEANVIRVRRAASALGVQPSVEQELRLAAVEIDAAKRCAFVEKEKAELTARLAGVRRRKRLPVEPTRASLRPGEVCHCEQPAEWQEPEVAPTDPFNGPQLVWLDGEQFSSRIGA